MEEFWRRHIFTINIPEEDLNTAFQIQKQDMFALQVDWTSCLPLEAAIVAHKQTKFMTENPHQYAAAR